MPLSLVVLRKGIAPSSPRHASALVTIGPNGERRTDDSFFLDTQPVPRLSQDNLGTAPRAQPYSGAWTRFRERGGVSTAELDRTVCVGQSRPLACGLTASESGSVALGAFLNPLSCLAGSPYAACASSHVLQGTGACTMHVWYINDPSRSGGRRMRLVDMTSRA